MRCFVFSVCVLALAAGVAAQEAPDTQVGDFLFKMPLGWNRVDQGDMTYIEAPSPPPGTKTFFALATNNLEGDLQASFKTLWNGYRSQNQILQGGEIGSQHSPNGYDAFYTAAIAADSQGQRWKVFVLGAQFKNHIETIMFMSNVFDPELSATYENIFHSFLSSLRFTNESAGEAAAKAGDAARRSAGAPVAGLPRGKGKFNGIYRAVGQTGDPLSPQRGLRYKYVAFFPDGRFMEGIPYQGLEKFNEDIEIRIDPVGWGTYEMVGDVGRIVFPPDENSKDSTVWTFKEYPDHLKLRGENYILLDRCNGLRLTGTFRLSNYQSTYSAKQGITFNADGTFVDEGVFKAAGVMVRDAAGHFDFDDAARGRGAYRIANYTLELTYSHGVKRTSFFLDPEMPKTAVREFYLNTSKFARVPE